MTLRPEASPCTIGEVCDFDSGNGFRPQDWKTKGLPIIRIQNLNGSDSFNYFDGEPDPGWIVEPYDLLFAWAGVKGVSFGPTIWNGPKGVLNQHIYRIRPKKGINKRWLYYALLEVTAEIESKAHGFKTSLVHVRKADITRAKISLPDESEQKAVALALECWDTAIQKTEQLIAAKERHRDALIQRLYALSDSRGKASRFCELLKESMEAGSSGRHAKKITVKLYGKGVLAKEEKRQGSEQTQYFVRRAGQLIYSKLDFLNGAFGIVPSELDGYESTLDLPAFDIAPIVNPVWLLGYLTRPTYYTRQVGLARGQRKARRVHPSDLLASSLHVPPCDLQDRIAEILTSSQCDIDKSKRLLESLKTQKRGLMQKLLTGQWRLSQLKGIPA
ncbi:MAG: restriction endonuclease subunit S [Immundisolibacter sp.]|uniref:restriction endonuclease subunit S n=1 Tax=Immundisolibacter sp. TaxID=1934948 RepID=UPI003EE02670